MSYRLDEPRVAHDAELPSIVNDLLLDAEWGGLLRTLSSSPRPPTPKPPDSFAAPTDAPPRCASSRNEFKKPRSNFGPVHQRFLQKVYRLEKYPSAALRAHLVTICPPLTARQISQWFTNRRKRHP